MLPRSLGQLRSRQHARHLFSAFFPVNLADRGLSAAAGFPLFNHVVVIRKGCDLRQVGNAEHLIAFGERLQFLPHGLGGTPTDAGINLEGVDRAVLSACDTGVGEIKVGEGVFGLRRAFQVAGAKTVIMSLWPVEDKTTEQWMETLYREHFLNGRDTVESVRAASLQILNQRRANHQSTHPFYCGAFIAAGGWR